MAKRRAVALLCSFLLFADATCRCASKSIKAATKGCMGAPTRQSEQLQPIFTSKGAFVLPVNGTIRLREGDTILISCPNKKNVLQKSNASTNVGECRRGRIKIGDNKFDFNELQCSKSIRGEIHSANTTCGNNAGKLILIGYYIGRDFLKIIDSCYDEKNGNVIYTSHAMYGDAIRNASKNSNRPDFSNGGTGRNITVSLAYKKSFQKGALGSRLGSATIANAYVNDKSYLARGHLSPDADFLFSTWQFGTYFYVNACLQWQAINAGNWAKVESMVRRYAARTGRTLSITTGTHGVLELPNVNKTMTQIYLLPVNKLRVPKYLWKLVHDERTQEAMVFFILNNPFIKEIRPQDYFCDNICHETGWKHRDWPLFEKGVVHCCYYKDFAEKIPTAPRIKVLRGLFYQ